MASPLILVTALLALLLALYHLILVPLFLGPLSRIPGPKLYALTKWRLAFEDWTERRTRTIHTLHRQYGPTVRIGPNEVHFNSLSALRTIYGPGSGFGRPEFYRMFEVYGRQNLFTFHGVKEHADRKRLLAHAYAKSSIITGPVADMVDAKILDFLQLIEEQPSNNIATALHYYSLDNITNFLYGANLGGTSALKGNQRHRDLLDDILNPARRKLFWFAVHLPGLTKWLYVQTGMLGRLVKPFLPMQRPTIYTGIRAHALKAMQDFKIALAEKSVEASEATIVSRLWQHHISVKEDGLTDLDIASETADHFLAGIDTTSDTLTFVFWTLSLPENAHYQAKLAEEARSVAESSLSEHGFPTVEAADKLPYLNAILKETLRLFAVLPAAEPRTSLSDIEIDGYKIPAGTVVAMSPYSLHRNAEYHPDPLIWNPERWLGEERDVAEMKKWWWPFSSGARMCVGMHLAMAEMAIVPAVYRKYSTKIKKGHEGVSPGITSRVEVFYEESFDEVAEHACWIDFEPWS